MENKIAEKIVEKVNSIVPIAYNMQEREELPYAVFTFNSNEPFYTKAGISGFNAEAVIFIAANSENEASKLKNLVIAEMIKQEKGWSVQLSGEDSETTEDTWAYLLTFYIKQN